MSPLTTLHWPIGGRVKKLVGLLSASALLSACSMGVLVGDQPSEPPPRVAFLGAVDGKGAEYETWDRPWAFGRVPAELQARGDISCMKLGLSLRATGYHPRAEDRQGNTTPGGGFFCQPQALANAVAPAPKVVVIDGRSAWDNPGAFGAIPADKLNAARAACQQQNPQSRPLAYHPAPLDAQGAAMPQGGFLCVD